jgi:hypothetical protein
MVVDWKRRLREAAIFIGVGLFMAFIRPYGATVDLPFLQGAIFWTGLILFGTYVGQASAWVLSQRAPDMPSWATILILSVISAVAVTWPLYGIESLMRSRPIPLGALPSLFGMVWVISLAMTGIGVLLSRSFSEPAVTPEGADLTIKFMERLPVRFRGGELWAVSSEDHYLRVHTSLGEELILMRLADAMRDLGGTDGLQTHRSWWVAKAGVADARREGGKLYLVLKSGKAAPVSRTYASAVKQAGLS